MKTQPFEKHVWAEIDLDALRHNFRAVKARAGDLPLCAVVKADSYGHGAVQCARVFAQEGAAWLAVSCLTEAVQLRQDGQALPILILGHVQPEYAQTLIHEDITVACYSTEQAQNLSAAAVKAGGRVKIHLKADTGMGRIGFALRTDFDAAIREMLAVCELPGLEMTACSSTSRWPTTPPKRTLPTPRSSTHCSSERSMRSRRQAASRRPSTVTTLRA